MSIFDNLTADASTTVVNCKTTPYDVLVDRTTIFGNPFKLWNCRNREECLRRFEDYFYKRLERDLEWKTKVLALSGKVLGCHCKPLPCHGDVYTDWLNMQVYLRELGVVQR